MRRTMLSMESLQEEEEDDDDDDDDEAEEDEWEREKDAAMWRSVLDEASQKTYYYHIISRESVWDKPLALCSARERADVARRNDQQRSFFAEMEGNIRTKIGQGLLFGGATPPSMPSTPAGGKFAISMVAGGGTEEEDPSAEQRLRRNPGDRLCRTISTMDDSVVVAQLCAISPRVMDSAYCASPEAPGSFCMDSGSGGGCGSPPALAPLAPPSASRAPAAPAAAAAGRRSPGWGSTSCPAGNDIPVLQRLGYNRGGGGVSSSDRKSYGGGGRIPQLSASKGGGGRGGGGNPGFSSSTGAGAATSCNPGGGSGGPDLPRRSHRRQLSSGSGGSSSGSISAAGELAGADEFPAGGSGAGRGSGVYRYDDAGACVRAGAGLEAAGLAEHGGDGHFTEGAGAGAGGGGGRQWRRCGITGTLCRPAS
ncbi:unnamed protein product [Ectocarpus sp. 6 AP-2014]